MNQIIQGQTLTLKFIPNLNISGATVYVEYKSPDGVITTVSPTSIQGNNVLFKMTPQITQIWGNFEFYIKIIKNGDTSISNKTIVKVEKKF